MACAPGLGRGSERTTPVLARDRGRSSLRDDLHMLIDLIVDAIEEGARADEWVDQKRSPLGRAKHLALAKSGKIAAVKEGRQVLVKRSDIDAYLAKHKVVAVDAEADEKREVARLAATIGRGRRR